MMIELAGHCSAAGVQNKAQTLTQAKDLAASSSVMTIEAGRMLQRCGGASFRAPCSG